MQIIKNRKIYFSISGLLVAASIFAIAVFGLNLGIDFTGGSLSEIELKEGLQTDITEIEQILISGENPVLESVLVQKTGENGYVLRFRNVNEDEHQLILKTLRNALTTEEYKDQNSPSGIVGVDEEGNEVDLSETGESVIDQSTVAENRFETIGPTIGGELKRKSIYAMIAVILVIIAYIAWAFRKVSEPVSSWKYGVTAVIALLHDVIIPTGVFAVLGYLLGIEIDILFVTALLTILGFSVNDTIVVFDRTRENLARSHYKGEFEQIVNKSVNQTIRRSLYTSLTTFVVLMAIYLFGGESIKNFVLALVIGVIIGTYSSIFLASPLLVEWEQRSKK